MLGHCLFLKRGPGLQAVEVVVGCNETEGCEEMEEVQDEQK